MEELYNLVGNCEAGIECQANQASATSEECTVAWGMLFILRHIFLLFFHFATQAVPLSADSVCKHF